MTSRATSKADCIARRSRRRQNAESRGPESWERALYTEHMPPVRSSSSTLTVAAALVASACGDPPDKEIQQAQGAIDAARATGADMYAKDEFDAALQALTRASDAVTGRDYRLALNHALDARERAQTAAKEAADRKATAKADADRALADATTALNEARAKLQVADNGRVRPKAIAPARRAIADGETAVQKARTAFDRGDYAAAMTLATAPPAARCGPRPAISTRWRLRQPTAPLAGGRESLACKAGDRHRLRPSAGGLRCGAAGPPAFQKNLIAMS